jgi:hypothetical protein
MSFEPKQIEMVCLEDLVSSTHIYRKFLNLWNLDLVRLELERLEAESDYKVHPEIPPHPIFHLLPQNFLTIFFYQKSRGHPSFSGK